MAIDFDRIAASFDGRPLAASRTFHFEDEDFRYSLRITSTEPPGSAGRLPGSAPEQSGLRFMLVPKAA